MRRLSLNSLAWLFYGLLLAGGLIWMALGAGGLAWERVVDPATWQRDLLLGLGSGLLLLGCWQIARRLLPRARELEAHLAGLLEGLDSRHAISLAVLSGVGEEVFFRGAVQGAFGLWVATLLFALLHTGPGRAFRLWTLFAAVAGLLLGLLAQQTGNLLAPIVAHFLVNAVNLTRLLSRRPTPPAERLASPPDAPGEPSAEPDETTVPTGR